MTLKGVAFGIRDVLGEEGESMDRPIMEEVRRLLQFLQSRGIGLVSVANSDWTVGEKLGLKEAFKRKWGIEFDWYTYGQDGFPAKQRAAALAHIRERRGWDPNEMLYIGNSMDDFQSAVNGGTLFLNALWFGDATEYGFRFNTPKEVARFIDVFCLREHWWYFIIEDGDLRVYTLAPYSTMTSQEMKSYSSDFITTVKKRLGDKDDAEFWAQYLCTSMYFSGVYQDVNYLAPYPGHKKGTASPSVLQIPMTAFAKCFRYSYLEDLIVRHTASIESKSNRSTVDHLNQLRTIHLRQNPIRSGTKRYKIQPVRGGKTVLVIDDILTSGYSFEAARSFIARTGAKTICVGFLKAMKHDYEALKRVDLGGFNAAFEPHPELNAVSGKRYGYYDHIVDLEAPTELASRLDRFQSWDWAAE